MPVSVCNFGLWSPEPDPTGCLLGSQTVLSPGVAPRRRSEFVDSRAAVQDNDPDYELDEDEEADEPPDDSDEDMEAAPRRCVAYQSRNLQRREYEP